MNTTTMILPALGLGLFASLAWGMTQERAECAQAAQTVQSKAAPSVQSAEPTTSVAARSLVRFLGPQEVIVASECQEPSATASQAETVVLSAGNPVLLVQDVHSRPIMARLTAQDREPAAKVEAQIKDRAAAEQDLTLIQEQMAGLRPSHSRYKRLQAEAAELGLTQLRDREAWLENAETIDLLMQAQREADLYAEQSAPPSLNRQREDARTRRLEARIEALERRLAERDARQTRALAPLSRSRFGLLEQPEAEEVEPPEEPYFTQRPAPAPPQAPQVFWRRAPEAPDAPDADFLPAPRLPSPLSRAPRAQRAPAPNRVQLWASPALPPSTNQTVDLGELSELLREMREQVSDLRQDLRSLRNDLRQLSASGLPGVGQDSARRPTR